MPKVLNHWLLKHIQYLIPDIFSEAGSLNDKSTQPDIFPHTICPETDKIYILIFIISLKIG